MARLNRGTATHTGSAGHAGPPTHAGSSAHARSSPHARRSPHSRWSSHPWSWFSRNHSRGLSAQWLLRRYPRPARLNHSRFVWSNAWRLRTHSWPTSAWPWPTSRLSAGNAGRSSPHSRGLTSYSGRLSAHSWTTLASLRRLPAVTWWLAALQHHFRLFIVNLFTKCRRFYLQFQKANI